MPFVVPSNDVRRSEPRVELGDCDADESRLDINEYELDIKESDVDTKESGLDINESELDTNEYIFNAIKSALAVVQSRLKSGSEPQSTVA